MRTLAVAMASVVALGGCGSDDQSAGEPAAWIGADVRTCLESEGAVEATRASDVDFYRSDRDADLVDSTGVIFNRAFLAGTFEPSARPEVDPATDYVVYVLQRSDSPAVQEQPDPIEALDKGGDDAAVWFLGPGKARERGGVEGCFG